MTDALNVNNIEGNIEQELSERLRNGDAGAVEDLFTSYFRQVYSVIFHAVGRNRPVAEDITQDTFLSATKSVSRFKGNSKPYTWLLSIAHHKIADYYRRLERERRHETRNLEPSTGNQYELPDDSAPLHSRLETEETNDIVTQALGKLPHHYREVLIYKYVEEMPVKQISQIMGKSPKSIEALLTRARNILKSELDKVNEG